MNSNYLIKLLIGCLIGAIIGIAIFYIQPKQFVGKAIVRIGQMNNLQGNSSSSNNSVGSSNINIEPVSVSYERLKSSAFIASVLERDKTGSLINILNPEKLDNLTVRQIRNGDSIEIGVVGGTFEQVSNAINLIVEELLEIHKQLLGEYLATKEAEISRLNEEVQVTSKQLNVENQNLIDKNSSIAANLIIAIQPGLEWKKNYLTTLRSEIMAPNVRKTMLVGNPSVVEKKLLVKSLPQGSIFGALIGLLITAVLVRWKKI